MAKKEQAPEKEPKAKAVSELMRERKEKDPIAWNAVEDVIADRPISYSSSRKFMISPWHFYEYYFGERTETDAFDVGNLFELMLLEPDTVDDRVVIYPPYNLRKPAHRELKAEFDEQHKGKLCVKEEALEDCLNMYERAIKDPEVSEWLDRFAAVQESKFFDHKATGLRSIAKIDARTSLDEATPAIIDVKTTGGTADPDKFLRSVMNYDYWLQAGIYVMAYNVKHFVWPEFYWMVFETTPPYGINIIKADPNIIDEGKRVYDNLLKGIKFCSDAGHWDKSHKFWRLMAPYDSVRLPGWHRPRI